jgi:hypothetical protein
MILATDHPLILLDPRWCRTYPLGKQIRLRLLFTLDLLIEETLSIGPEI